ncbi:metallophosphoesterase [Desulfuromonas sp.]|uniref:metallophosphoesterase n=1 Tax=Desulfuromonas sp. TaxID=892 RepID=UPI0025BC39BD|nr:metallophosphoesterase [Desulfuromonas sp.]
MNREAEENKKNRRRSRVSRRAFLLGGGAAGGLVLADALVREPRAFQVQEVVLPLAKVPPGRELRLVHLSDLHIRSFHGYFEKVARTVNGLEPDLILLTGDYLEQRRNLDGVQRFVSMLKAPGGIFAVQGNWEYWARLEGENLRRHFARWGATLLINRSHDLDLHGVPLSVLGLDYPSPSDRVKLLARMAAPERVNLLLSHVPAFDHQALEGRIDLILCGHTHGGQVRLPFVPPFYLPRFSEPFIEGLYRVGPEETPLYVTRGVGTSILPVRFLCRPEITLLRLHAA